MTFQIPEDLNQFSVAGLEDLRRIANTEYQELKSNVAIETVTVEELERLEELQGFIYSTIPGEISSRQEISDRFTAATSEPEEATEEPTEETPADEPEAVVASTKVTVANIKANSGTKEIELPQPNRVAMSTLVAAASVSSADGSYENGQHLTTMLDVAKIFEARSASHQSMDKSGVKSVNGPIQMPVATLIRNYPDEFSVNGDQSDYDKLLKVADESRLPGGSLLASVELDRKRLQAQAPERDAIVAAQGWCAPSETDYDICLQITTDGLADFPEVQARRGGIRHNTGLDFSTIFGVQGGQTPTGFFDLTEAQVASGTTKTCIEIPCPSFVDTRLGVTGLCLTGNILAIRGYPEYTATFTRGAMAASAHQINREQVSDVVTGSTAVDLTAAAPWATDGSATSQIMSAVEMAITDIKYRLRMQRSATLEVIMPWWVLAQMRADFMRRPFVQDPNLTDAEINAFYATRGARVQYIYDWQDAFSSASLSGTGPGAATPISSLPKSLQFLVFPAGTWIRAVSDVITLNSVYDSTKLATNQVTHLFTETGWAMVQMCPLSRVYTVPICPSGKTTSTGTLTCP
jgi:hypothetical protein